MLNMDNMWILTNLLTSFFFGLTEQICTDPDQEM